MQRNVKCIVCKSFPNILVSTTSNKISQVQRSQSLPSCLKFVYKQAQYDKINLMKKKKSNPTIGELLGDDDLFHDRYHNQYSSSKFKRKRPYHYQHRSYSRSSHIHVHYGCRKQRRTTYLSTIKDSHYPPSSPAKTTDSIPDSNQVYLYPPTYTYTSLPTSCYYCYSNMAPYSPCLLSDYYAGLYQQEPCSQSSIN